MDNDVYEIKRSAPTIHYASNTNKNKDDSPCDSDSTCSDLDYEEFTSDPLMHAVTVAKRLESSLLSYMSRMEELAIKEPFHKDDYDSCVSIVDHAVLRMSLAIHKLDRSFLRLSTSSIKKETSQKTEAAIVTASGKPATTITTPRSPAINTARAGIIRSVLPPPSFSLNSSSSLPLPSPPPRYFSTSTYRSSTVASTDPSATVARAIAPNIQKFEPGTDVKSISNVFYARIDSNPKSPPDRYISRSNCRTVLVRTDGFCSSKQTSPAQGAYGIWYRPTIPNFSFALERCGPTGSRFHHTSSRVELRAAITAVDLRSWKREGFDRVVIATDFLYVVNGATTCIKGWQSRGVLTVEGQPVLNRDLWEELLRSVADANRDNLRVLFWHIPREWNITANELARDGLRKAPSQTWIPQARAISEV